MGISPARSFSCRETFMAIETNDVHDFHEQLKAILPRLRIYALSLTRDRDAADDLVHDTVIKALTGRRSFQPGTNLAAWLFRIQRNEFISGLRRQRPSVPVDADFQVESYLRYQGSSFVERFDANSYLYLTRAMDYFDIAADHEGVLARAFRGIKTRFCVVSFTSDWLFPTAESRALVHALNASSARVSFAEIE